MVEEEVIKSVRLSPEEAKILEDHKLSFTDLVRNSLERLPKETEMEKKKDKIKTKKQVVNDLIANGVYTIIGLALLSALNLSSNFFTIAIIGGLGAFFTLMGGIRLYLTIRGANLYGGK